MKIFNLMLSSESKDDSGTRILASYPDFTSERFDDIQSRIRASVQGFTDEEFAMHRFANTPDALDILCGVILKDGEDAILWGYEEGDLRLTAYVTVSELVTDSITTDDILTKSSFPIACLSKCDLEDRGFDTSGVSEAAMQRLAEKMGEDYCQQMFYESMETLADIHGIPMKTPLQKLQEMLPSDGTEVDISDDDNAPSWTFFDDDNDGYTDRATAMRVKDGKAEVKWEGERCHPACWEPLENIEDDDDFEGFIMMLTDCVREALDD